MIHTVKGFSIFNEAEVDVSLEFSCFFCASVDVDNMISGSSAFSKSSLNIWKFSVHVLLKPHLENFEHSFASVWDESSYAVFWTVFGIAFLWDWNENWPFLVLQPLEFSKFAGILSAPITASSFRIWNSSAGIPSPPLTLFIVMVPKTHLTLHSRVSGCQWVITLSWLSGWLR